MKQDTDDIKENKEILHQEIMESSMEAKHDSKGNLLVPGIRVTQVPSSGSIKRVNSNEDISSQNTRKSYRTRTHGSTLAPKFANKVMVRRNSVSDLAHGMKAQITQFVEFKFSDRETFKKKLQSWEKGSPAQDLIRNLREQNTNNFKGAMTQKLLLKAISSFYADKIANSQSNRRDLSGFLYEKLLKEHGVQVADHKFTRIAKTCYKWSSSNKRVWLFSHFLGLFDNVDDADVNLYLECIDLIDNKLTSIGTSVPRKAYDLQIFVPFKRAEECANLKLRTMISSSCYAKFTQQLLEIKKIDPSNQNKLGVVDVDHFMSLFLRYKNQFQQQISEISQTLFNIVDGSDTGYLQLKECILLVRHISKVRINKLIAFFDQHSETTPDDKEKAISIHQFTEFAIQEKVFSSERLTKFMKVVHSDG